MPRSALLGALLVLGGGASGQTVDCVEDAFPGVTFVTPVGVEMAPGQPGRVYVVEQGGPGRASRIVTLEPGDPSASVFLDLSDRTRAVGEAGLLGLAFHPGYAANGRLFVYYTAPADPYIVGERVIVSRIVEFARSEADPLAADPASERVLLEVDQPAENHNGGKLAFGPDGHLYIALGDGGGADDQFGNGQDVTTLLGALLRIDVDDVPAGAPYGIPDDNPFAPTDGPERDEIYAYGLRNPWKFSITSAGDIWLADVGQGTWEEVDRIVAGGNYGWNWVEGPACFRAGCDLSAYEAPVAWYGRTEGQSITGGYVVETPGTSLTGSYLFGDFVSGRLWALPPGATEATLLLSTVPSGGSRQPNISSIDPGPNGAPLLVDYAGTIYAVVPAAVAAEGAPEAAAVSLRLGGANPFREATAVVAEAPAGAPVRAALYDALGREVALLYDAPAPAGPLRLEVDGSGLAPGLYRVRLDAEVGRAEVPLVKVR